MTPERRRPAAPARPAAGGPLAELAAGQPGDAFVALLQRTVLAVATARNFPPPGGGAWTSDEVASMTGAFLADGQTPRRLADLLLHCGNEVALARRLQGAVRNFLRDQGRATEVGRLIVRLRRVLHEDDGVVAVGHDRWGLVDGPVEPSAVAAERLTAAAADVEVAVVRWSAAAERRAPFADRDTLVALVRQVLRAADGTLTPAALALAVAPRLAVVARPVVLELDPGDHPEPGPVGRADVTGDEVANRLRAEEVVALLTDRERIAIGRPELVVRDLGPLLGVSRSQAQVIRQRAVAVVREELADDEDAEDVARVVLDLSRRWLADRTGRAHATYGAR